jgi:sn-glycerol 3-phosphate transport system ATP-binding protein
MSSIVFDRVAKTYDKTPVVRGIDLDIKSGEFVVILGPSGCGKSTLLRMVAGLEAISGGEISIDGKIVNQLEPRERGCAMVFQNYALYPHMSVAENIGYALKVSGVSKAERQQRIATVAQTVGLTDFLDRKPGALSGGQRQRVAMARAMIREPKVFLFDEPLSNLDAQLRVQMRIEIRKLHNRLGVTSIFVTHDQIEAMTLADRLVVMNAGRIEQVGAPDDVYRRPATKFVAGFVGSPSMNLIACAVASPSQLRAESRVFPVAQSLQTGQKVLLGVRPEDVIVCAALEPGSTQMDVDFIEELGSFRMLHGRVAEGDFCVQIPASDRRGTGPLALRLDPLKLHLFDNDTGLRIDPAPPHAAAAE